VKIRSQEGEERHEGEKRDQEFPGDHSRPRCALPWPSRDDYLAKAEKRLDAGPCRKADVAIVLAAGAQ
jgi:hypothetical protein